VGALKYEHPVRAGLWTAALAESSFRYTGLARVIAAVPPIDAGLRALIQRMSPENWLFERCHAQVRSHAASLSRRWGSKAQNNQFLSKSKSNIDPYQIFLGRQ
jgi:hypothetical protein